MSFIVTARKWRPNRFEDVIGQEHITITLKNAIKSGRIAHAYIFAGPRGVGKTTTARILAKTLNCLAPVDFEPCNKCDMCQSFNTSQSLDIIEIDGASNRRIEEIRTLRESVKYAPTKGTYKVYIIDEVHMLTNESFNALLKTLEEPPEHTIFIFATTDVHKVPLTIISRCQRFDFRRIELNAIKTLLGKIAKEEGIQIDDQTLTLIARKADGALRDAESIFDQIVSFCGMNIESTQVARMLNLIDDELYFTLSDAVINKTFIEAFNITRTLYDNGWNFVDFMNGLIEHFRNIMTVVLTQQAEMIDTVESYKGRFLKYKDQFNEGDLLRILNFLNKTQQEMRYTQNHRLKIEVSLCHLIGLERSSTITEVISQLSKGGSFIQAASPRQQQAQQAPQTPQNMVPDSQTHTGENLAAISDTWNNFVGKISDEKFILGSALTRCRLASLEGDKLLINVADPADRNLIDSFSSLLNDSLSQFYNRRPYIGLAGNSNSGGITPLDQEEKPKNMPEEQDPIIRAVINELGGKELK